jgi:hypothetical protein
MQLFLMLVSLPFFGRFVRWAGRLVFGIKDEPNIQLGESLEANSKDTRLPYRSWFHVRVENRQRSGTSKCLPTRDAEACTVSLEFASGAAAAVAHDGVFLVSDTELPKASVDLIVDRPTYVPVYIVASQPMTIQSLGMRLPTGAYVTSGRFFHPDLLQSVHLEPGNYVVAITVKPKNARPESRTYSITVPDFHE